MIRKIESIEKPRHNLEHYNCNNEKCQDNKGKSMKKFIYAFDEESKKYLESTGHKYIQNIDNDTTKIYVYESIPEINYSHMKNIKVVSTNRIRF